MKTKIILSLLAFGLVVSAFSQKATLELTFTAENNGQYVPLDSIFVENLTSGEDTTLYAPDTVLVLDYVTSITDNKVFGENTFSVSQNYPNPFKGKTEVNLILLEKEYIKITVQDILGSKLADYNKILPRGNHTFSFYAGNESYYLLTVTGKQKRQTIKMLNTGSTTTNGEKCKIVYIENMGNNIGYKSRDAINGFVFNIGDELKYIAFTDVEETEIINSPTGNQTYTFQFDGWTPCPGTSTVTDIDGNIYNTVQIGDQCWMKENLKTTTYSNGTPILNEEDSTGTYYWYEHDIIWKDSYGAIYNWYTTVNTNGLCPTGWHVPMNDEWTALTDFIGGTGSPHGNELKSCRQVNSPLGGGCNTSEHPRFNESTHNGTDDYGFSGLPGGSSYYNGYFGEIGSNGKWWSSTEESSSNAWFRFMHCFSSEVIVYHGSKYDFISVRCLSD